jgi:hypothetical protein
MAEKMDATADGIRNSRDVFALAFQCVAAGITAMAAAAPVHGPHGEMLLQSGKHRCPGGMIAARAVRQQQRRFASMRSACRRGK